MDGGGTSQVDADTLCTLSSTRGDKIRLILSPKRASMSSLPGLERETLLGDKAFVSGGMTSRFLELTFVQYNCILLRRVSLIHRHRQWEWVCKGTPRPPWGGTDTSSFSSCPPFKTLPTHPVPPCLYPSNSVLKPPYMPALSTSFLILHHRVPIKVKKTETHRAKLGGAAQVESLKRPVRGKQQLPFNIQGLNNLGRHEV